jgi:hypothetical protein
VHIAAATSPLCLHMPWLTLILVTRPPTPEFLSVATLLCLCCQQASSSWGANGSGRSSLPGQAYTGQFTAAPSGPLVSIHFRQVVVCDHCTAILLNRNLLLHLDTPH